MTFSRRDLAALLPALAASSAASAADNPSALPSKVYHHEQIPYSGDAAKKGRRFFFGPTHGGFRIEMHETILGPGRETHPPHKHIHEETIILLEGTAEAHMDGKTEKVEAGSVVCFGSNQMHNLKNIGDTPIRYYVVEFRGTEA